MYVAVCSADVHGEDHWTYALQIILTDIHGTTGRTLLFEYPLDNTWMYETLFGPLCKNHWMYVKVTGRLLV
jgi:hypothetical protein